MDRKVSFTKVRLMYGLGDFYGGASVGVISLLFMFFLTNIARISPAQAGLIVFIGRAVDAVTDPMMGAISDRTRAKSGRRAPYFLFGALPVVFSFMLLWIVPPVSGALLTIYFAFVYSFFSVSFTIVMIPYSALAPELTTDANRRGGLVTTRMACSIIGGLISAVLPSVIISMFHARITLGYFVMAAAFGGIFGGIWLGMYFVMKGKEAFPSRQHTEKWFVLVRQVFRNKSFPIVIAIYLLAFIPNDISGANFKYFLNYYLEKENVFSLVVGTTMVCAVLSLPGYLLLMKRVGKAKTMLYGSLFRALVLCGYFLLSPGSPMWLILLIAVLNGAGMGVSYAVPWAMLPEVTDLDEARHGTRNEGIYSGIMTFMRKVSSSVAMLTLGLLLEWSRYSTDAPAQPASAVLAIRLTTILAPLILTLFAAYFAARYPIGFREARVIRELADQRRDGSFERLSAEQKTEALKRLPS